MTMKNVARLIGMLSAQILLFGFLFKLMHWPYATMLLLLGTFSLCFISTPIWAYSSMKSAPQVSTQLKMTLGLGLITAIVLGTSVFLRHFHLEGGSILMVLGFVVLIVGFVPVWYFAKGE